ncbi:MAG: hypothetical protein RIS15_333, partial [Chloroflexota bacterium]
HWTRRGPVHRRVDPEVATRPRLSLEAARAVRFTFGRYAGATVDAVGRRDPGYLAWCVDNVRRDPELAQAADCVLNHLAEEFGVQRPVRGSLFRPSPVAFDGGTE